MEGRRESAISPAIIIAYTHSLTHSLSHTPVHSLGHEQILRLDVAVQDVVAVQIVQTRGRIRENANNLEQGGRGEGWEEHKVAVTC